MKVNYLVNKIPWFGKYSGYEILPNYIPEKYIANVVDASNVSLIKKIKGKYLKYKWKLNDTSSSQLSNAFNMLKSSTEAEINHILYLENHLYLMKLVKKYSSTPLAATIHLPFSQWNPEKLSRLEVIRNPIILYESEINKFQHYLSGPMKFIRLGVDTSFFKPGNHKRDEYKILVVGHYLRNLKMLERVVRALLVEQPNISFHIIIPKACRNDISLTKLASNENVVFYDNISDDRLLNFYQTCSLMLMPMNDSGANTALVQAIACGIPIVTTNNGGVKSYGGGDIYPIIDNNDDIAMTKLVFDYLYDDKLADDCSKKLRDFSLSYLDWNVVVEQYISYYNNIKKNI